jgi:surface protein
MFRNTTNFNQPIGSWNTSNVLEMNSVFENADAFNQSISNWDVSKVTNMRSMFESANLFNQPLHGWNTSSLVDGSNMFKNASAFNQDLGNWNLSSATNLMDMLNFSGISCEKYDSTLIGWANNPLISQNLTLGAFGKKYWQSNTHRNYLISVKNWQIIGDSFSVNCEDLVTPNSNKEFITQWHFPQSTNTVFFNVSGTGPIAFSWIAKPSANSGIGTINGPINQISININQNDSVSIHFNPQNLRSFTIDNGPNQSNLIDVKQWGGVPWQQVENMFWGCENLQISAVDTPNLNNAVSLSGMFKDATLFNSPLGHWNISNIKDLSNMFNRAISFNQPIDTWNTTQVTNMSGVFANATNFNHPLANWNTENVTDMSFLFSEASNFNQLIGNWNTSKVKDMYRSFFNAISFNQPLNSWNTISVIDMAGLFNGASSFNQHLNNWNTSNVEYMYEMFRQASNFNQPIALWNTSKVKDMFRMFNNATSFNQPIGNWSTSNVEYMFSMFSNATSFDQSLSDWDLTKTMYIENIFNNSGLSCEKYDSTIIGWYHNPSTPSNLNLGATGIKYWLSKHYRSKLISEKGWTIQGDINDQCNYTIPCTEITWVGNTGNWNNPDNWNYSVTPIPCQDVLVKNPTDIIHISSGVNAEIKSLNNNGVINIQYGGNLLIKN